MGPDDLPSLLAGSAEVVPAEELERKLTLGRPLRVRTSAWTRARRTSTLRGHAIPLRKLRQFRARPRGPRHHRGLRQAMIGDPSGGSETRRPLTPAEVRENARTYAQAVR